MTEIDRLRRELLAYRTADVLEDLGIPRSTSRDAADLLTLRGVVEPDEDGAPRWTTAPHLDAREAARRLLASDHPIADLVRSRQEAAPQERRAEDVLRTAGSEREPRQETGPVTAEGVLAGALGRHW